MRKRRGKSLVEILVVMAIALILLTIAVIFRAGALEGGQQPERLIGVVEVARGPLPLDGACVYLSRAWESPRISIHPAPPAPVI